MSNSSTGNSERGIDVLHDPTLNKSTGYTEPSDRRLGWLG